MCFSMTHVHTDTLQQNVFCSLSIGFSLKSSNVFSTLKCLFKVVREEKDIHLSAHCITVIRNVVKADIINSAT